MVLPSLKELAGPLCAKKSEPFTLNIGFQNCPLGGPFGFTISSGSTRDVGFLKLYVSTCELDMDSLVQCSPFSAQGPPAVIGLSRGSKRKLEPMKQIWDTYRYAIHIRSEVPS